MEVVVMLCLVINVMVGCLMVMLLDSTQRRLHAALFELDTLKLLLSERESSGQSPATNSGVTGQPDRE